MSSRFGWRKFEEDAEQLDEDHETEPGPSANIAINEPERKDCFTACARPTPAKAADMTRKGLSAVHRIGGGGASIWSAGEIEAPLV